jgi:hypothetical protein
LAKSCPGSTGSIFGTTELAQSQGLLSVRCGSLVDPTYCPNDVPLILGNVVSLAALGPRVFLASSQDVGDSGFRTTVLSRDFSDAQTQCPDLSSGWEVVAEADPRILCDTLAAIGPNQVRLQCQDGNSIDFDQDGNIVRSFSPANEPGLSNFLVQQEYVPGFRAALTFDRRVQWLDLNAGSTFVSVYGAAGEVRRWEGPVVAREDGFWVFGRHGLASHVVLDTNGRALESTTSTLPGIDPSACLATAAALDHADGSIVVALSSTGAACSRTVATGPWLYRFHADGDGDFIGPIQGTSNPSAILGIAETSTGSFALFSDTDDVFRLKPGGALARIQDTEWIDLAGDAQPTPATETQHLRIADDLRYEVKGQLRGALRAVAGANGVGFISGEEHVILRVIGDHAKRFSTSRVVDPKPPIPNDRASSSAILALCADDVLFDYRDAQDDYDHDDIFQLVSTDDGVLGLRSFATAYKLTAVRAGYSIGVSSRLLGDERRLLLLYGQDDSHGGSLSNVLSLDGGRAFFPLSFTDGAVDARGIFLLTATAGHLLSVVP